MFSICWIKLLSLVLGGASVGLGEAVGSAAFWEFLRRKGVANRKDLTKLFIDGFEEGEGDDTD